MTDDGPRRVQELQRIGRAMRGVSFWAGVYAVETSALLEELGGDSLCPLFLARPQRQAHPRFAVGSVLRAESATILERCGFGVLSALRRRMLAEARWETWELGCELAFRVLSRREAWQEGSRQVLAFGPFDGRAQRLRELKGHIHKAFAVLGFHDQPRDDLLAVEPLRQQAQGGWRHEFGAACAVGACSVVLTRQVAAWIVTGEDD